MNNLDTDARARDLLISYHELLRGLTGDDAIPSERVERAGPIVRRIPTQGKGTITYRDLDGMDGEELNKCIADQLARFARVSVAVEWKYHHYDAPADLPQRLRAAGFTPATPKTVMVAEAIDLAIASRLPTGLEIREIGHDADLERLRGLQERVSGTDLAWLPETLRAEQLSATTPPLVLLAESRDEPIACGWMRFHPGSEFVSLSGGAVLPPWRGKGIFRALLAHRAQQALRHGYRYLWADCDTDGSATLRHLGAAAVANMTPYVWDPEKPKELDATGGERPALS